MTVALKALSRPQFALLLERVEGIGRVTSNRILRQFRDLDDLRRFPREQLLLRLAGLPKAEQTVGHLFDDSYLGELAKSVDAELAECRRRRVVVCDAEDAAYPARLTSLKDSERPTVIYLFGEPLSETHPVVAVLGHPPLVPAYFDNAQRIVEGLAKNACTIVLAAKTGFDVAMAKRAVGVGGRVVLVAESGLDLMPREIRPTASLVVKSGGTVTTSFPFGHGPFEHDAGERVLLMAAMANAVLICDERPAPYVVSAARWSMANRRSVFSFTEGADIEGAHVLRDEDDEDWLRAAAAGAGDP